MLRVVVEDPLFFSTIPKGSVAVDGVSLTVVNCDTESFSVALIPHTLAATRFRESKLGDLVNLETDHIGKWVKHLLGSSKDGAG